MKTLHIAFKVASIIIILILLTFLIVANYYAFEMNDFYISVPVLVYLLLNIWVLVSTWDLRKLRKPISPKERSLHPEYGDDKYKVKFGYADVFLGLISTLLSIFLLFTLITQFIGKELYHVTFLETGQSIFYLILLATQSAYCLSFQIFPKKIADYIEKLD